MFRSSAPKNIQFPAKAIGLMILVPSSASANMIPPPSTTAFIGINAIPVLVTILGFFGGFFVILRAHRRLTEVVVLLVCATPIGWFLSTANSMSYLALIAYNLVTFLVALTMIKWGILIHRNPEWRRRYIQYLNPRRLITCALLMFGVLYLGGFVFIGYYDESRARAAQTNALFETENLLRFWLSLNKNNKNDLMNVQNNLLHNSGHRFEGPWSEISFAGRSYSFNNYDSELLIADDTNSFSLSVWPTRYPHFPAVRHTKAPCYYVDQSGNIRSIKVDHPMKCPADAPVIARVEPTADDVKLTSATHKRHI